MSCGAAISRIRLLVCTIGVVLLASGIGIGAEAGSPLKLLISLDSPNIAFPLPARVTLHLHNAGSQTLWLYRNARPQANEGSTVVVHLEYEQSIGTEDVTPGGGHIFSSVNLPHPRLVRLAPGGDYEEKHTLHLSPAEVGAAGSKQQLWGKYRLQVIYAASYTNQQSFENDVGQQIWNGQVESNTVEVNLQAPAASSTGQVSGVVNRKGQALYGALVSLNDRDEKLVDQAHTDGAGQFAFQHLPLDLYWVTARDQLSGDDVSVFQHVELTAAAPESSLQLNLPVEEIYEAKKLLHKPVLLRVTTSGGQPMVDVELRILRSSGTILEVVKGQTADDGTVAVELMPGSNYVTIKRRGCDKEEQRIDVSSGEGAEAFPLTMDCGK
jgi:hypothetical protein